MARGGNRQGTAGRAYSNRTDLAQDYNNGPSAAAGGQVAPAPSNLEARQQAPMRTPDDSPMLSDPTARPNEPVTAGLAHGPGAGPEALGMDTRAREATALKAKWLPILQPVIEDPDTPDSVRMLFRYLRGA